MNRMAGAGFVVFLSILSKHVLHAASPVIQISGSYDITLEAGATWVDPGATCTDAEDGTLVTSTPSLNTKLLGPKHLSYSCTDAQSNTATATRSVFIQDTTPPVLAITGDNPMYVVLGTSWSDPGVSCTDNSHPGTWTGPPNLQLRPPYEPNLNQVGKQTVTYECSDSSNNKAQAVREVVVIDRTVPVLTLDGPLFKHGQLSTTGGGIVIQAGDEWRDPGAVCEDTTDGKLAVAITGTVNSNTPGTYSLRYQCNDATGNEVVKTRQVLVAFTARSWRISPIGQVSFQWFLRGITFFQDFACTDPVKLLPERDGRRWPNGAAYSTPKGSGTRASSAFSKWVPGGGPPKLQPAGWNSGGTCNINYADDCYVGFFFESPVRVGCIKMEQGNTFSANSDVGTFAPGLKLQWRDGETGPFRDAARIERGLAGGAITLAQTCFPACHTCDAAGASPQLIHPCVAY